MMRHEGRGTTSTSGPYASLPRVSTDGGLGRDKILILIGFLPTGGHEPTAPGLSFPTGIDQAPSPMPIFTSITMPFHGLITFTSDIVANSREQNKIARGTAKTWVLKRLDRP